MSIFKVSKGDIDNFSIVTNPRRTYVSSSLGVTGSLHVYKRRSHIEKDVSSTAFLDSHVIDGDIEEKRSTLSILGKIVKSGNSYASASYTSKVQEYFDKVASSMQSSRLSTTLDVLRIEPTFTLTTSTFKKIFIKDTLSKYYRSRYPTAQWSYTNYNCLNFHTSSNSAQEQCLLYPNNASGVNLGRYVPTRAFTMGFHINPRYHNSSSANAFHAGTVMHLSGCIAVSLVSGSARDENNLVSAYRLLLQLSSSTSYSPDNISYTSLPDNVFLTEDNALTRDKWHDVAIRWGTSTINNGTGSILIDGTSVCDFVVPTLSITQSSGATPGPGCLCVGNFFIGSNVGSGEQKYFFATNPATRDGLEELDSSSAEVPTDYRFNNPLNAEIHDLYIRNKFVSDNELTNSAPESFDSSYMFYVPPSFTQISPFRQYVGDHGGVPQTPFYEINSTTNDPFNVALSFGVGGHYINIENFVRDIVNDIDPLCHHLTATIIENTTTAIPADEFLEAQPFVVSRNKLIMPCDDGLFTPNFDLVSKYQFGVTSSMQSRYTDVLGIEDFSVINIDNMLNESSLLINRPDDETTTFDDYIEELLVVKPESPGEVPGLAFRQYEKEIVEAVAAGNYDPGIQQGAPLTVYQRTKDSSSNQIVIFDVSNLFYGDFIEPKTLVMTDTSMSGSNARITLRDNGMGSLYRSDSPNPATWNNVGDVFYDEGLIVIKSPHLFRFGKSQFKIEFKGSRSLHVMKLNVVAQANSVNSSSNVSYIQCDANGNNSSDDQQFVYVSGINFHDDNYNIVAKAALAQPIKKTNGSTIGFKVKFDF